MITRSETSLTESEYNAILTQSEAPYAEVVAKRYNLRFSKLEDFYPDDESFDAEFFGVGISGEFLIVSGGNLYVYDHLAEALLDTIPFYDPDGSHVSISSDGTIGVLSQGALTLWSYNGVTVTQDSSFSHPFPIVAAKVVSNSMVLCAMLDSSTGNSILGAIYYDFDDWVTDLSQIYWPYPIQSFDACHDGNGKYFISMITELPAVIGTTTKNGQVTQSIERTGGIIGFPYENGFFSQHVEIDIIDKLSSFKNRLGVRVTHANGLFILTCSSMNGVDISSTPMYRYYTSSDARAWSNGFGIHIEPEISSPFDIVVNGDYTYATTMHGLYRSYTSECLGYSAPSCVRIIPFQDIESFSLEIGQVTSGNIVVSNESGVYTDDSVISPFNQVILELYYGVYVESLEYSPVVRVAKCFLDTLSYDASYDNQTLALSFRSLMSFVTDRTQSEEARYYDNAMFGCDSYDDYTATGYGGLKHTATQYGAWKTINGDLVLTSKDSEGLSFNTFNSLLWNGSYTIKYGLSTNSNSEYCGIVFRAIDRDNLMYAYYDQASASIKLGSKRGGEYSVISSHPISGFGDLELHSLRVEFNYSLIRVYYSRDNVTWYLATEYIQPSRDQFGSLLLDRGFVGQISKGWAPQETLTNPDFGIPDFDYDFPALDFNWKIPDFSFKFPSFNLAPSLNNLTSVRRGKETVGAISANGYLYRTGNFYADNPGWSQVHLSLLEAPGTDFVNDVVDFIIDPNEVSGVTSGWVLCYDNVYYLSDIFEKNGLPVLTHQLFLGTSASRPAMDVSTNKTGTRWQIVSKYDPVNGMTVWTSQNRGSTWSSPSVVTSIVDDSYNRYNASVKIMNGVPGKVYVVAFHNGRTSGSITSKIYQNINYGSGTWSVADPDILITGTTSGIITVPFEDEESSSPRLTVVEKNDLIEDEEVPDSTPFIGLKLYPGNWESVDYKVNTLTGMLIIGGTNIHGSDQTVFTNIEYDSRVVATEMYLQPHPSLPLPYIVRWGGIGSTHFPTTPKVETYALTGPNPAINYYNQYMGYKSQASLEAYSAELGYSPSSVGVHSIVDSFTWSRGAGVHSFGMSLYYHWGSAVGIRVMFRPWYSEPYTPNKESLLGRVRTFTLGSLGAFDDISPRAGDVSFYPLQSRWGIRQSPGKLKRYLFCGFSRREYAVFKSINSGKSWTKTSVSSNTTPSYSITGCNMVSDDVAFLWGRNGVILYTTDFMKTVKNKKSNIPDSSHIVNVFGR